MPSNFSVEYERTAGQHAFTLLDGTQVTALATDNWDDYETALCNLPPTTGLIVSTELITTPYPLEQIPGHFPEAEKRVRAVIDISLGQPDATILLGTPSRGDDGLLRNSLAVIANGQLVGHVDKRGVMWPTEAEVFTRAPREQAMLATGHAALICSDLIIAAADAKYTDGHSLLSPAAQSLIVSSCWAVPRYEGLFAPHSNETRFRGALERTVAELFAGSPQLQEVVVVDRAIDISGIPPLTGHFHRT